MTLNPFIFQEAIASVSLSHDANCDCLTCRAASGDEDALAEMWAVLTGGEESP